MAAMPASTATTATPGPPIKVLIVDDDPAHAQAVADSLNGHGYDCQIATSGTEGTERLETDSYEVVITDLRMNDIDGMEILKKANEVLPDAEVIVVTGHGTVQSAVQAMQDGAFNYLLKPLDLKQLRAVIQKATAQLHLRRANAELLRRLDEKFGFEGVIGNSPEMHRIIDRLRRIAPTDASVLILGDNGTGKELVAKAIHQNSPRKSRHFVGLNCAALSENILESELFGHVRGAFTDAAGDRMGRFEYADGGTLFLDELGDMPMPTQIKLLRVLESGEIHRVGSNEPIKVDVRVISATHRDLEEAISAGTFRQDLYHRLKVVTIALPRLVDRAQDIPLFIEHFMKMLAKQHQKKIKSMSTAARRRLMAHDWPGNVRELRNVIESMVVVDEDGVLDIDDLPFEMAPAGESLEVANVSGIADLVGRPLAEIERIFVTETLKLTAGNREEAAKMLGIGERTLYRKIKEYGLN